MTGRRSYVTDYTNASRIMLMDLKKHRWDRELLEFFKIPEGILPEIKTSLSSDGLGHLMEADLPAAQINADLGDQQAALFGERCFSEGNTKVTYGTGSFILQNTGKKVVKNGKGLISTCAYGEIDGSCKYALEGSTQVAGELFDWLTSKLQMFKSLKDIKRNFD
ncbi:MAG: FGGY family carbohydrate kinase, partial [Candidatus Methanomethyliaceae archaeon]